MHETGCSGLMPGMTLRDGIGREVEGGFRMGTRKFETSHVGGATGRTPPIPRSALEKALRPGTLFEGNPVGEGTTRRGSWWLKGLRICLQCRRHGFDPWVRKCLPIPVFLPGESQGWGSLVGCRLWGGTESDTTEVT